jgi:hypothetical protein
MFPKYALIKFLKKYFSRKMNYQFLGSSFFMYGLNIIKQ